MRKTSAKLLFLAALIGVAAASPVFGSGSYPGRPPRPPAGKAGDPNQDREKYTLGQKVFDGGAMTPGGGNADAQRARLQVVQAKLPAEVAKMKDLVALAGKLSAKQLMALEHFVSQRFPMKK